MLLVHPPPQPAISCIDVRGGRYMKRGTLARTMNKPISTADKFCAYELCDRPKRGTKFHYIEVGCRGDKGSVNEIPLLSIA